MSLYAEPSQSGEYEEYLDEHTHRHNERSEASAKPHYYHHRKEGLERGEYHKCCPATLEEQSGIARQDEVVGLQFVDYMQCDEHSDKESQEEYRAIDEPILAHK